LEGGGIGGVGGIGVGVGLCCHCFRSFVFSSGPFFGVRDARSLAMQSFVIRGFVMSNVIGVRRVSSMEDLNVVLSVASLVN
jgi:hypothetical protein